MVAEAISRCDVDIRRDMWAGIVLSGTLRPHAGSFRKDVPLYLSRLS